MATEKLSLAKRYVKQALQHKNQLDIRHRAYLYFTQGTLAFIQNKPETFPFTQALHYDYLLMPNERGMCYWIRGLIRLDQEAYEAAYFGEQDISDWSKYASREFWRVEGGYDAFSTWQTTGDQLPESNYPMALHQREFYAILYHLPNGGTEWWYGVSTDQTDWYTGIVTVQVTPPVAA